MTSPTPSNTPVDRWIELDLYWFDRDDIAGSADQFWDRFAPLFQNVDGWKGVVLCVGWLMDYITEWQGRPDDLLPLPKRMHAQRFPPVMSLTGSTEERKAAWRQRIAGMEDRSVEYAPWTYADLQRLAVALRQAAASHGIPDFKVGTLVVGTDHGYDGARSAFASRHPHVFDIDLQPWHAFNVEARLGNDERLCPAFPQGVPPGLPAREFFAAQWGEFSRAIGIDALILRDSMIGAGIYRRRGPFGATAPDNPQRIESYSQATRELVKATKLANPKALVIGYSNGGQAVGDWRVNCVDLESLANDGYLDAYIDQTWAGAWNEVGQRPFNFWNAPGLGWTYQLAFTLVHGAVLTNSKVRHYTLADTFDAWESWDTIHTAPERLRWGIWAFSHAAVKTPAGLKFPEGTYVSWGNCADQLLNADEVTFLAANLDAAAADARHTVDVLGPTLVYARPALEWFNQNAPAQDFREWIDEQAGGLMKWSVPILSITRVEWLSQVRSDLFVLQTPAHLPEPDTKAIEHLIRKGEPVLLCGAAAGGVDPRLLELLGIVGMNAAEEIAWQPARLLTDDPALRLGIPEQFALHPSQPAGGVDEGARAIYEVAQRPALVLDEREGRSALWWEPPEPVQLSWHHGVRDVPLEELLGSPYPFVLAARCLQRMLAKHGRTHARDIDLRRPVWIGLWKTSDGCLRLLAADLEEGLDHSTAIERSVSVCLPESLDPRSKHTELWHRQAASRSGQNLQVNLQRAQSLLFSIP